MELDDSVEFSDSRPDFEDAVLDSIKLGFCPFCAIQALFSQIA